MPAKDKKKDKDLKELEKFVSLAIMAIIDRQQSHKMFHKETPGKYKETNPLLNEHPSRNELDIAGVIGLSAVAAAQKFLPDNKFKEIVIDSILETEKQNIEENRHLMKYGNRKYSPGLMLKANWKF